MLAFVLAVSALLPLPNTLAEGRQAGYRTQTIMVYIIGSDLESGAGLATGDISEMLRARPDKERLNVLVMTGGTTRWKSNMIPHDKLSVFRIEGNNPKPVRELEKANMGEPSVLADFLKYGMDAYPADSYGLVLWDHAGGPLVGFGSDTAYKQDQLTLAELKAAMEMSPFTAGNPLEWVAFDACLMGSTEVAAMMSPFTRYMIASEETMPGKGFDYRFLADLAPSGLTGPEVATALIQRTYDFYEKQAAANPLNSEELTLSLLDLGRTGEVLQALDRLFTNLDKGLQVGIYSEIARRRDGTKTFARNTTENEYDLIDLTDLARNMAVLYPQEADALDRAVSGMVVINRTNVPRSNGLTIYFPLFNKEMFGGPWGGLYQQLDFSAAYKVFVDNFGKILLADRLSQWTGSDAPAVTLDEATGEYYIQLSADQVRDYKGAQYYVLARVSGEEYTVAYMSSNVTLDAMGRLRANFNGKTMFIQDPVLGMSVNPLMNEKENDGGIAKYQIPAVFDRGSDTAGYESTPAYLLAQIDKNAGTAAIVGAIRDDQSGSMLGKRDTDITQWDNVTFTYNSAYLTRGKGGELLPLGDWAASDSFRVSTFPVKNGLSVRYGEIPAGLDELSVLISVMDTQGFVYSSELMPLKAVGQAEPAVNAAQMPEAKQIDYLPDGQKSVLLMDDGGIRLTLTGIVQGDEAAPWALSLRLLAESALDEQTSIDLDWAAVNGYMMNVTGFTPIPARGQAEMKIDFPIPYYDIGSSMAKSGIDEVKEIRFRLKIDYSRDSVFKTVYTQEFQINTGIPLGEGYTPKPPAPFEPMLLAQGGGVRIELVGTPFFGDGNLLIPLRVDNSSAEYDLLRIAESSVNGIMAPFTIPANIRPGTVMYAEAQIPLSPFIVPPELAEYQFLYEGRMNDLETLGITQIREFTLRFELDEGAAGSGEGSGSMDSLRFPHVSAGGQVEYRSNRRLLLDPYTITFTDMQDYVQPLDTQGDLLLDSQGIRIVRLSSDPEGKQLYIYNSSPHNVHISTFGLTQVDGVSFSGNLPIRADVSAGKSAYARLFGFIPGMEPQGKELTFTVSLIDLDGNKLLYQSPNITLTLQRDD